MYKLGKKKTTHLGKIIYLIVVVRESIISYITNHYNTVLLLQDNVAPVMCTKSFSAQNRGRDGMSKVGGLGVHEDLKHTFVLNIT